MSIYEAIMKRWPQHTIFDCARMTVQQQNALLGVVASTRHFATDDEYRSWIQTRQQ